jgi:hypothetical protein
MTNAARILQRMDIGFEGRECEVEKSALSGESSRHAKILGSSS